MPTASGDRHPPMVIPSVQSRRILEGQKCLVTGANSGIGKAVAIALGRAGADVAVNYVSVRRSRREGRRDRSEFRRQGLGGPR